MVEYFYSNSTRLIIAPAETAISSIFGRWSLIGLFVRTRALCRQIAIKNGLRGSHREEESMGRRAEFALRVILNPAKIRVDGRDLQNHAYL